jgi:hypothetical protein
VTTTIDPQRLRNLMENLSTELLRDLIGMQRAAGFAFGVVAEACRVELAKRGEQA